MIIWFTGLSGAGKTTISNALKKIFEKSGYSVFQVDGDIFRKEQKNKNAFTREEISENNYRIIDYCRAIQDEHDFIFVSVIAPFGRTRKKAREVFGKKYIEVFVDCPIEFIVKNRDKKGLYNKALKGEIDNLIGFSSSVPYEIPENPEIVIRTDKVNSSQAAETISDFVKNYKNYGQ